MFSFPISRSPLTAISISSALSARTALPRAVRYKATFQTLPGLPAKTFSLNLFRRNVHNPPTAMGDPTKSKSEGEWRAVLSPEQVRSMITHRGHIQIADNHYSMQFRILRQKGTEPAGSGQYDKFYEEGVYACAGCGTPLYKSATKFKSGCGWPAFFDGGSALVLAFTQIVSSPFSLSLTSMH